jgi:CubicO group peptidase (beta-lactamase class C family)
MKLTQLFLNEGRWEGQQIVSREWVQTSGAALRVLSPGSGQTCGYLWNSFEYPYRGSKLHAYFPGGNGGQVYIGIPDLDLLIAFTRRQLCGCGPVQSPARVRAERHPAAVKP